MSKIQKNSTSYPGHEKRKTTPIHDQIQIALALVSLFIRAGSKGYEKV
jgi:hypothetical protein